MCTERADPAGPQGHALGEKAAPSRAQSLANKLMPTPRGGQAPVSRRSYLSISPLQSRLFLPLCVRRGLGLQAQRGKRLDLLKWTGPVFQGTSQASGQVPAQGVRSWPPGTQPLGRAGTRGCKGLTAPLAQGSRTLPEQGWHSVLGSLWPPGTRGSHASQSGVLGKPWRLGSDTFSHPTGMPKEGTGRPFLPSQHLGHLTVSRAGWAAAGPA